MGSELKMSELVVIIQDKIIQGQGEMTEFWGLSVFKELSEEMEAVKEAEKESSEKQEMNSRNDMWSITTKQN